MVMVEVKGFAGSCPGSIDMSINELNTMERVSSASGGGTYLVLVVEEAQSDSPRLTFFKPHQLQLGDAKSFQVHLEGDGVRGKREEKGGA